MTSVLRNGQYSRAVPCIGATKFLFQGRVRVYLVYWELLFIATCNCFFLGIVRRISARLPTFHVHDSPVRHFLAVGLLAPFLSLLVRFLVSDNDYGDASVTVEFPQLAPLSRRVYVRLFYTALQRTHISVGASYRRRVNVEQNESHYRQSSRCVWQ